MYVRRRLAGKKAGPAGRRQLRAAGRGRRGPGAAGQKEASTTTYVGFSCSVTTKASGTVKYDATNNN